MQELAHALMRDVDANRDDRISLDEFKRLIAILEALRNTHFRKIKEKEPSMRNLEVRVKPLMPEKFKM